jgi:hypothetical protein
MCLNHPFCFDFVDFMFRHVYKLTQSINRDVKIYELARKQAGNVSASVKGGAQRSFVREGVIYSLSTGYLARLNSFETSDSVQVK